MAVVGAALLLSNAGHAAAAPSIHEYVALGDSWAADGTVTQLTVDQAPAVCAQSSNNYPKLVARTLGIERFEDATCSAATTVNLTEPQRPAPGLPDVLGVNPPQFDRLTTTTDLVTLGIGGNDTALADTILTCVNPSTNAGSACQDAWTSDGVDRMSGRIDAVESKVVDAVGQIRIRAPHARILVVDYLAGLPVDHGCFAATLIPDQDLAWLGRKLTELNASLRRAAVSAGAEFVDTYATSVGHDGCQTPGVRWVEGLTPLSAYPPGIAAPFHPNQLGADHQARMVLEAVSGIR